MTTDDFHQRVLAPFIQRHSLTKAAVLLRVNKGYLSRVNAGARPITQKMAARFGVTLSDPEQATSGKWPRNCPDCHEITYHRRVWMEQMPQYRAVQCAECLTIEIELQARSLLERN